MMFQRFADNVDWLEAMGAKVSEPDKFRLAAAKLRRNQLLVFSRYCQVMFRFEMARTTTSVPCEARAVPQAASRPEPAVVGSGGEVSGDQAAGGPQRARLRQQVPSDRRPAYYHNYMLGEMFASQVHHALVRTVLPGTKPDGAIYVGNKAAGQFMKRRVFEPGLTLKWDDLTRHATGEPLSPKAFAEDLEIAN